MKLQRAVPCQAPPRLRRLPEAITVLPPLILAFAFAIGSVIAGLHT
jgi:hypothetical protein